MLIKKKQLLELLDKGAIIELAYWGDPTIYARLDSENIFGRIHISSFFAVKKMGILEVIRKEGLWVYYRKKEK